MSTLPATTSKQHYLMLYQALLSTLQDPRECRAITQRVLAHYCNCDKIALMLNKKLLLTPQQEKNLAEVIHRIKHYEPLQYIMGEAYFLGRAFKVSPAVLIPRPETEEFVSYIIQNNPKAGPSILDIGTGSGCIAITLQKELTAAKVTALDIAQQALVIAAYNAKKWQAALQLIQADILQAPLPAMCWDIIVSNPPYVRLAEKKWMQRNVLDHEPPQALFVADDHPLLFYERIITLATMHLKKGGRIYFEINEAFGKAVAGLLAAAGFSTIRIMQDLQGKDRWIAAMAAFSAPCNAL